MLQWCEWNHRIAGEFLFEGMGLRKCFWPVPSMHMQIVRQTIL